MRLFRTGVVLAVLSLGTTAVHVSADDSGIYFAAIDNQPIITLTREHGMVRGVADLPLVSVYADGRVVIDRPAYMVQPGKYEQRLDPVALNELIQSLDQSDVLTASSKDLAAQHARATSARSAASGIRTITTDETTTRIHVRFASFARAGESPREVLNTLSFVELQTEAQQHSSLKSLVALAAAETRLMALFDQPQRAAAGEQSNAQ